MARVPLGAPTPTRGLARHRAGRWGHRSGPLGGVRQADGEPHDERPNRDEDAAGPNDSTHLLLQSVRIARTNMRFSLPYFGQHVVRVNFRA